MEYETQEQTLHAHGVTMNAQRLLIQVENLRQVCLF
jgi:hypothetical protein